jgi:hypothetical protein
MTFLDLNYRLTKTMFDWGQEQGLTINLSDSTVRFREFHHSQQTQAQDWFDLWKRWVLSEEHRFAGLPEYHGTYYAFPDPEPNAWNGHSDPMPEYLVQQINELKAKMNANR